MTYEQLCIANDQIHMIDIKGNDYAQVNQRIKAFRLLFPNGTILTEILSHENGVVVMKATAFDDFGGVLGTGHAYEKEGSSFINNTSYIENCETSAVGRALGMIGLGVDTNVCSAEEVANAIKQQSDMKPITQAQIQTLEVCIPRHKQTIENICDFFGVQELSELTVKDFMVLMSKMGENQ